MILHWIDFTTAHRNALLKGEFRPHHPELNYPLIEGADAAERVIGVYAPDLAVKVADDGSVPLLTVSGAADLSAGGTVRLTGAVRKLAVGAFPILAATPGFDPAVLANWTLVVDGEPRRILSLGVVDGKIVLKSERIGAMLLVR